MSLRNARCNDEDDYSGLLNEIIFTEDFSNLNTWASAETKCVKIRDT